MSEFGLSLCRPTINLNKLFVGLTLRKAFGVSCWKEERQNAWGKAKDESIHQWIKRYQLIHIYNLTIKNYIGYVPGDSLDQNYTLAVQNICQMVVGGGGNGIDQK